MAEKVRSHRGHVASNSALGYKFQENQVYKKIVWRLDNMTKEKIEAYQLGERLDSPSGEIRFGDNIVEWYE